MKKLLALVLALVMTLGLATVGASAAYSDAAEISNTEAVDVMSALKVFDGMGDGSFAPKATLTREQAAKIIASMIIGKAAADALGSQATIFSDVAADRWSAGSIAFCNNEGIIAGVGNGKFDPTGTLTGYAFAKMCLVALGYDPEIEGLVGANWQVNTAKLALAAGLTDDLSALIMSGSITREQACQMALNTETATMVQYSGGVTVGDVKVGATRSEVGNKTSEYRTNVTTHNGTVAGDDTMQFCERYATGLKATTNSTDDFGRSATTWAVSGKKVGVYSNSDAVVTYTAETKKATVKSDLSGYNNFKATLTTYTDGVAGTVVDADGDGAEIAALTGNARKVEIYADNNAITKVVITNTFLAKITAATSSKLTMTVLANDGAQTTAITGLSTSDWTSSDFAKDDYVLITLSDDTALDKDSTVQTMVAATKVTGLASSKNTSDKTITLDGTAYKAAANIVTANNVTAFAPSAKYDATLYTDGSYVFFAESGSASNDDQVIGVLSKYQTLNKDNQMVWMVKGVLSNGEIVNWQTSGAGITVDPVAVGEDDFAAYNYVSATGIYQLTALTETNFSTATTASLSSNDDDGKFGFYLASGNHDGVFTKKTLSLTLGTGRAYVTSDTKYIFLNDGKATTLTGAQTIADATDVGVALKKSGDNWYVTAVFVQDGTAPASATSTDDIIFVNGTATGSVSKTDKNGDLQRFTTY